MPRFVAFLALVLSAEGLLAILLPMSLASPSAPLPTVSPSTQNAFPAWEVIEELCPGIPPEVVYAVILVESGGRPDAVSPAGAIGLMQVMPYHAFPGEDLYDPLDNIRAGCRVLSGELRRFGNIRLALAAYYAGPRRVHMGLGYADRVLGLAKEMGGAR